MNQVVIVARQWWEALVDPRRAGGLIVGDEAPIGFSRTLFAICILLYALYGLTMGLFNSPTAAFVSAVKAPCLYLLSLAVCFPALLVLNCIVGPRLKARQCVRLLIVAQAANAGALASFAPVSFFFTVTAFEQDYPFLVMVHVVVFAFAGLATVIVAGRLFHNVSQALGAAPTPLFLTAWALVYGFVGTQMAWVLRPWVGSRTVDYTFLREMQGSFFEAVWTMAKNIID